MGFTINCESPIYRAIADDPYLEGIPSGGGLDSATKPHREEQLPVGLFVAPLQERPHECCDDRSRVWCRRL